MKWFEQQKHPFSVGDYVKFQPTLDCPNPGWYDKYEGVIVSTEERCLIVSVLKILDKNLKKHSISAHGVQEILFHIKLKAQQ